MDTFANTNAIEVVPYENLEPEVKDEVDKVVQELETISYNEIISYGWDIQNSKNEMVKKVFVDSKSFSYEEVNKSLNDVMGARKAVMPREQSFLRKAYVPSFEEKRDFIGVVGELEQAIKAKIQDIFELNRAYFQIALESKKIADRYAIIIMAIDKYLASNPNTDLHTILNDKRVSFLNARISHISSMLEYPVLYYNGGRAINKLNEVINLKLYQLQEQLLIQSGINEIKSVLNACDGIKNAIYNLTQNNMMELEATTKRILASEPVNLDEHNISEKIRKFNETLSRLESLDMLENKEVPQSEDNKTKNVDAIPSETTQLQHFLLIDKAVRERIENWAVEVGERISEENSGQKLFLSKLKESLSWIDYDYAISLRFASLKNDKIYFAVKESETAIPAKYCIDLARGFAPKWKSDIVTEKELVLLQAYYFAVGEWNFFADNKTAMHEVLYGDKKYTSIGNYMNAEKAIFTSDGLSRYEARYGCSIKRNIMNDEYIGNLYLPVVLYNPPSF